MTKLEKGTMSQKWLNEQLERAWQETERWISYTVALQLTEAGRHEKRRNLKEDHYHDQTHLAKFLHQSIAVWHPSEALLLDLHKVLKK
jgi:hypothetical protein